jgi:hypothetical protein
VNVSLVLLLEHQAHIHADDGRRLGANSPAPFCQEMGRTGSASAAVSWAPFALAGGIGPEGQRGGSAKLRWR